MKRAEFWIAFGLALFLGGAIFYTPSASADDWPEWRGKGRLGVWNETGLLERFPAAGLKFRWRKPIRSGYGGPAVAEGRVFVTDFERTGRGTAGVERLIALDEKTGETLWEVAWDVDTRGLMATYANGPRATPTVDGDRVYALGSTGRLKCVNVADGAVLWTRDYIADFNATLPAWGMVGAPLVDDERLLCLVGGEGESMAIALDKMTGDVIWSALAGDREPGYAPPIILEAAGARQLIIWEPQSINSLDPKTGKVFWSEPYEVSMGQTIVQPVASGARLIVSTSSHGSTMLALDGERPSARLLWKGQSKDKMKVDGIHAFLSTPFIEDGYIYGIGGLGYLRCVEAETGRELWATLEPSEDARIATAFLVKNGDRFFINNDRGELIIARLSPEGYDEIGRTKLIKPTHGNPRSRRELGAVNWSHPAYANGHIFQRNDEEIVCASLMAQ